MGISDIPTILEHEQSHRGLYFESFDYASSVFGREEGYGKALGRITEEIERLEKAKKTLEEVSGELSEKVREKEVSFYPEKLSEWGKERIASPIFGDPISSEKLKLDFSQGIVSELELYSHHNYYIRLIELDLVGYSPEDLAGNPKILETNHELIKSDLKRLWTTIRKGRIPEKYLPAFADAIGTGDYHRTLGRFRKFKKELSEDEKDKLKEVCTSAAYNILKYLKSHEQ